MLENQDSLIWASLDLSESDDTWRWPVLQHRTLSKFRFIVIYFNCLLCRECRSAYSGQLSKRRTDCGKRHLMNLSSITILIENVQRAELLFTLAIATSPSWRPNALKPDKHEKKSARSHETGKGLPSSLPRSIGISSSKDVNTVDASRFRDYTLLQSIRTTSESLMGST